MRLDKIIYDVREMLNLCTDDMEVSDRYITHLINIKRSKYLRQDANNYQRTTDTAVTQTLCLELETASADECSQDIECDTIVRTKRPIPHPIEGHIKTLIITVKPTNRIDLPFTFTIKQKAIYYENSPFPNGIYAFLDNDYHIYLLSNVDTIGLIECISVTAVFEDPMELASYTNCCGCEAPTSCFDPLLTEYPLQPHYVDLIKNEIVKELAYKLQIQGDTENDANDDGEEQKNHR